MKITFMSRQFPKGYNKDVDELPELKDYSVVVKNGDDMR